MAAPMLCLLAIPLLALLGAFSPAELYEGLQNERFGAALGLSIQTTVLSLLLVVGFGTPLAWWLANAREQRARWVSVCVDLPLVLPPAVVGLGLLLAFSPQGGLGAALASLGIEVMFQSTAVVLAQVVVSAPFYIQSAAAAFRRVDPDLLLTARTLGQSSRGAFFRVAVPLALPGLLSGAALAWGRALGEFGATLLFAGNLPGETQTLPLAIYTALESDVRVAVAIALVLAAAGVLLLWALRGGRGRWAWESHGR